jgi:hypothetical protein
VRVRRDDRHVLGAVPGRTSSEKPDRQDDLAHDLQRLAVRELVERRGDRALDGVSIGTIAPSVSPARTASSAAGTEACAVSSPRTAAGRVRSAAS